MIICDFFKRDLDETLKNVQLDAYDKLVGFLYKYPRNRFLNAVNLLGVDTPLSQKIKQVEWGIEHRSFQMAHDILAAWFRYRLNIPCQLSLFPVGDSYEKDPLIRWTRFYRQTVQDMTDTDDAFVLAAIKAVSYANTAPGYQAGDELNKIIGAYCQVDDWLEEHILNTVLEPAAKQLPLQFRPRKE